jgi:hypothetical protein
MDWILPCFSYSGVLLVISSLLTGVTAIILDKIPSFHRRYPRFADRWSGRCLFGLCVGFGLLVIFVLMGLLLIF